MAVQAQGDRAGVNGERVAAQARDRTAAGLVDPRGRPSGDRLDVAGGADADGSSTLAPK
ncbi:hypothetical protein ACFQ6E_00540 [Streptomyces sp. NPDC056462]|uniref:hypothetical protein n=1 Tax=Streptomyces sp. NPDC056462 TaxID=3345826 RepID=UPI0036B939FE